MMHFELTKVLIIHSDFQISEEEGKKRMFSRKVMVVTDLYVYALHYKRWYILAF